MNHINHSSSSNKPAEESARFHTTHWSVVLAAGRQQDTSSHAALEQLCRTYWYPLYAYVRRRGYSPHDAQDLTQAFFAFILQKQAIARADPAKGRFRSFMLASINHFLANEWQKAQAQKRGGRESSSISLDLLAAEGRFDRGLAQTRTPEQIFDKEWAAALLETVLSRLEEEYRREGKTALFESLKPTLAGSRESQPYAELARDLKISEGAVKTYVHRLRKRYRHLVESEITNTVETPEEVQDELRHLFRVTANG